MKNFFVSEISNVSRYAIPSLDHLSKIITKNPIKIEKPKITLDLDIKSEPIMISDDEPTLNLLTHDYN